MPNYKLVNADQLDTDLTTVADKIREKAELSGKMAFPSGFVSGIDQCSSLNFTVVGGTSQPSSPKENTIWVNTSTTITDWVFGAEQPTSPKSGMVWIQTGDSSNAAFNALKKNNLQVYPRSAKQYVSYSWVDKTAKCYQNGAWGDVISELKIIRNGQLILNLNARGRSGTSSNVEVIDNSGYVHLRNKVNTSTSALYDQLVDVTNYNNLTLYANVISITQQGGSIGVGPVVTKTLNASSYNSLTSNVIASAYTLSSGEQTLVCDVSSINDSVYVGVMLDGGDLGYPELQVYDFYLS